MSCNTEQAIFLNRHNFNLPGHAVQRAKIVFAHLVGKHWFRRPEPEAEIDYIVSSPVATFTSRITSCYANDKTARLTYR
jgi:hypothetical protein